MGDAILRYLGITVDDFRIAGGIVLFIYAILGRSAAEEIKSEYVAVVPLATPLLAGPGAITVVISQIRYGSSYSTRKLGRKHSSCLDAS